MGRSPLLVVIGSPAQIVTDIMTCHIWSLSDPYGQVHAIGFLSIRQGQYGDQ